MNRLDPALKRLMKMAGHAPAGTASPEAPFGFSSRVVSTWLSAGPEEPVNRVAAVCASLATLVIAGGALFLSQQHTLESFYQLGPVIRLAGAPFLP